MLHSILLYLDGASSEQGVIEQGVRFAGSHQARVRGLTLLDTRSVEEASTTTESAAYCLMTQSRLQQVEQRQQSTRALLARTCLEAGLNFDVRRAAGNPFEVLHEESQFHDLVVASLAAPGKWSDPLDRDSLTAGELVELGLSGVQPLLVLRRGRPAVRRVLLVHDGSSASGRAIRSFLAMKLFDTAEQRLLAVGPEELRARKSLREMAEYCRTHCGKLETGFVRGSLRKVAVPYARKWQADLVVLGLPRGNRLVRQVLGDAARDVLKHTSCALYLMS
jgi:nucleotide-binding universal stress UspA family protein